MSKHESNKKACQLNVNRPLANRCLSYIVNKFLIFPAEREPESGPCTEGNRAGNGDCKVLSLSVHDTGRIQFKYRLHCQLLLLEFKGF